MYVFYTLIVYFLYTFLSISLIESILLFVILLVIGILDKVLEKLDWRVQTAAGIVGNGVGIVLIILGFVLIILNFSGILAASSASIGLHLACIPIGGGLLGAVRHEVKKPTTDKRVKKKLEW